jgi:uncharacterized integral membrane protein
MRKQRRGALDGSPEGAARPLRTKSANQFRVGLAIGALVTIAMVLLIAQNGESAQLDWLAFHFTAPLWIMLLLTAIAGGIVWELLKVGWRRGRQQQKDRQAALQAVKKLS